MKRLWKKKGVRTGVALCGAAFLPFVILTGYVSTASTQSQRNFTVEESVFWLSLVVGLIFLSLLPIEAFWRVVLGILYLPLAGGALFVWMLAYVCGRFGACL